MNVHFYIDRNKRASDDRTIWAYISERDRSFLLHTNAKVNFNYWDKKQQRAQVKGVKDKILQGRLSALNSYLSELENKLLSIADKLRTGNVFITFDEIEAEIKNQFSRQEKSLFDFFVEFIAVKLTSVSRASIQKYQRTKSLLLEFEKTKKYKLTFESINAHFYDKYFPFLINDKNMLNNSAHKQIQFLKTFLIWANQRGITSNNSHLHFKFKSEENEIIYLTDEELMTLYNFDFQNERLSRARDLFVFQCFTGVRYSDIQNLSRSDIKGATWLLRTQKTHSIIEIPLSGYACSILAKYSDDVTPLPIISNQKMNEYLKELCKIAEINDAVKVVKYQGNERLETVHKKYEVVGSHTARRTFISLSLQKGMPADVIMSITGHKSYKMMQRYLKIADSHKKQEMEKAWGSSLRMI